MCGPTTDRLGTRRIPGGDAGPTTTSAAPDVVPAVLVVVAAAAGLVWALAAQDPSEDARKSLGVTSPADTPKDSLRPSQGGYFRAAVRSGC